MLRLCGIALRKYNIICVVVKSMHKMLKIMELGRLDLYFLNKG